MFFPPEKIAIEIRSEITNSWFICNDDQDILVVG